MQMNISVLLENGLIIDGKENQPSGRSLLFVGERISKVGNFGPASLVLAGQCRGIDIATSPLINSNPMMNFFFTGVLDSLRLWPCAIPSSFYEQA